MNNNNKKSFFNKNIESSCSYLQIYVQLLEDSNKSFILKKRGGYSKNNWFFFKFDHEIEICVFDC